MRLIFRNVLLNLSLPDRSLICHFQPAQSLFFRLENNMARQEIILGAPPAGLGGDPPHTASMKINAMTQELYDKNAALGTAASANMTTSRDDTTPGRATKTGDYGIGLPLSGRNTLNRMQPIAKAGGVSFDYLTGEWRPAGSADGPLMTLTYNNEFYFQAYFDWRVGDIHTISKATPTTPEVWRKFYNSENALGLVSNGALLEFGSNANGEYARFPSGGRCVGGRPSLRA